MTSSGQAMPSAGWSEFSASAAVVGDVEGDGDQHPARVRAGEHGQLVG
jgi:hypothetical protein